MRPEVIFDFYSSILVKENVELTHKITLQCVFFVLFVAHPLCNYFQLKKPSFPTEISFNSFVLSVSTPLTIFILIIRDKDFSVTSTGCLKL